MLYRLADILRTGSVLILLASCQQTCIPLLCVQWKTPYDGQRNCLKHVEFRSEKLLMMDRGTVWNMWSFIPKNSWWWTEELSETCRVLFRKTPDDGQRNCLKHVSFIPTNPWWWAEELSETCRVLFRKTPDNGQRNCPKHVEFYSEKLLMMDRGTVWNMYNFIPKINLRN